MRSLPTTCISVMAVFAPVFSKPGWQPVKGLLTGAILAPGRRTITAALRVMGLNAEPHVQREHRVRNRAVWSPLTASRLLLRRLVAVFVPWGVVVWGLDDTMERRRGEHMRAKGIYRDPGRSSHAHVVKVSGLRWRCWMLLTSLPWAGRVWALPLMTVLCPSERFDEPQGRRHPPAREKWPPIAPCGLTPASHPCCSAGGSCAILTSVLSHRPCCRPTWTRRRSRS